MGGNIRTEWLNRHYFIQNPLDGHVGNCGTIRKRHGELGYRQRDFVDSDLDRYIADSAVADKLDGYGITQIKFDIKDWHRLQRLRDVASLGMIGL